MKTNPLIGIKVLIVATLSSVTLFLQLDACAQSLTPVHILVGFPSGGGADAVANLFTCDADGANARQLGFDQDHNWCPTVLNDGRVLYTR